MKLFTLLLLRLLLTSAFFAGESWGQLKDDGKTDVIQWDHRSLVVNGERVFVFSGEFHYARLPVPALWLDIFQKLRASGFTAVSIYFFWSFHSSSPDVPIDLETGARDIQQLFDYAKEAGIWVITRSGPYVNAETAAGGLALWSTTGAFGTPRTNDSAYHDAWLPWITAVGEVFARNGVDRGGPAILNQHENEFNEAVHEPDAPGVIYMEQIAAAFDAAGVTVPSSHNEKGMRAMSWSTDFEDVGGAVNIYGLDSYPNGFDCSNPTGGFGLVKTYYQWFQNYSFTQPEYMPEYQGGAFDPWGGFGYDNCALLTGTQFSDVFYKTLVAQKVSLMSFYMGYGGTNWGGLAAPVVYTSYDYGAHISESRVLRDKIRQTKLLGLFVRVSEDLRGAEMFGNGTTFTSDSSIYTIHLRNPDTNAGFYWVVHNTSSSTADTTFSLSVDTSLGNLSIPNIELNGRQSKFVVTDYHFGNNTLLYSSGEVLTYVAFDDRTILLLYLDPDQVGEFVLKDLTTSPQVSGAASVNSTVFNSKHLKVTYTQSSSKTVLRFANGLQIWLVDRIAGWNTWAPSLTSSPNTLANQHVLVEGPYLVRTANISGSTAHLTGDLNSTTTLEVSAASNVSIITWNGAVISTTRSDYGSLIGNISGPSTNSSLLPDLNSLVWKSQGSLPERFPTYNASSWALANHNTTSNPQPPTTLPVLYPDDYGFHNGYRLYRGTFTSGTNTTSLTLNVIGGAAFGFSVWLNGAFLYSFTGSPSNASATVNIPFGNSALKSAGNVVFILQDDAGRDEDSVSPNGPLNPRGISEARLDGDGVFTEWRIVGNAGGEMPVDKVRGIFNEGGLRAERLGWILPGFDDSAWPIKSPLQGLNTSGVEFYRTTFPLSLPSNYDIPLAISFNASSTTPARIQLYINGYQYGRYIPHIGPQTVFPVPPGIINNNGENTIGVSIWAQDDALGARLESLQLVAEGVFETGFEGGFGFNPQDTGLQPVWVPGQRDGFA